MPEVPAQSPRREPSQLPSIRAPSRLATAAPPRPESDKAPPRRPGGLAGDIALKSPEPDAAKAEAHFERALAVARQQQAKSWELRASMSMARLWPDQGKPQQARELLAPVYGWFTEGFDTLDLKDAKALLDELHA
jgi:hypothetical protein